MARNRAALAHKHGGPAVNYKYADFTAQDVADALPAYLRKLKRRKHKLVRGSSARNQIDGGRRTGGG